MFSINYKFSFVSKLVQILHWIHYLVKNVQLHIFARSGMDDQQELWCLNGNDL